MSRLRQVLKRPCGPPMGMAAGSTAAVAFEPAGPSSPRPAPPNPGQLVQVLMHEREARRSMGHMFVGVEVAGSMTHHGVSFEGAWLGAERPDVQQWGERTLRWPPGRSVPWVRVRAEDGLVKEVTLGANRSARERASAAGAASPQASPTLRTARQRWAGGSRSKIMRAVEDRPRRADDVRSGISILHYLTVETKMRAPLRGTWQG